MQSISNFNPPLKGIIPPMVTPLNPDGSLDLISVDKLIDHLMDGGVHGIFILGTTGEFSGLSHEVRKELVTHTCSRAAQKIPVLVGITDVSIWESIELANYAAAAGAYAVVAAPPFYMNIDQEEVTAYFTELASAISLPLFLYNMPSHTKISIEVGTVVKLMSHPNIVGLKDSSAHGPYFQAVQYECRNDPDFVLMVGPEEVMAETVLMGGYGGVCGGANLFPQLYVALYEAAVKGDLIKIKVLQKTIMEISKNIYQLGTYKTSYLKGLKTALSFSGLCKAEFASPLYPFSSDEVGQLKARVDRIKEALAKPIV